MYQSMPQHPGLMQSMMPGMPHHGPGSMHASAGGPVSNPGMGMGMGGGGGGGMMGENKSVLWMGEIDPTYMNEMFLRSTFAYFGEQVNVKSIRDKGTGQAANYCFIEFPTHANALRVLTNLNGTPIPSTDRIFKLNWASGGGMNVEQRGAGGAGDAHLPEFSIFVGDLSAEVTDYMLFATFSARYAGCRSAEVKTDPATGACRGYGFVRFTDEGEMQRAITEMNGQYLGSRPMRINPAIPKAKTNAAGGAGAGAGAGMGMQQQAYGGGGGGGSMNAQNVANADPNNTTVFVGGLTGVYNEEELRSYFAPFGEITYVKIPPGKGCGFIQYLHRSSAEAAIQQLQSAQIGNSRVRLSWGRSQADRRGGGSSGSSMGGAQAMGGAPMGHHAVMSHMNPVAAAQAAAAAFYTNPAVAAAQAQMYDPYAGAAMLMPAHYVPAPAAPAATPASAAQGAMMNGGGVVVVGGGVGGDPLAGSDVERENGMYAAAKVQGFVNGEKAGWRVVG